VDIDLLDLYLGSFSLFFCAFLLFALTDALLHALQAVGIMLPLLFGLWNASNGFSSAQRRHI
jgi:hypothetical protein